MQFYATKIFGYKDLKKGKILSCLHSFDQKNPRNYCTIYLNCINSHILYFIAYSDGSVKRNLGSVDKSLRIRISVLD